MNGAVVFFFFRPLPTISRMTDLRMSFILWNIVWLTRLNDLVPLSDALGLAEKDLAVSGQGQREGQVALLVQELDALNLEKRKKQRNLDLSNGVYLAQKD